MTGRSLGFARVFAAIAIGLSAAFGFADTTYMGVYLKDAKIGYESVSESTMTVDSRKVVRTDTKLEMNLGLLGSSLQISMLGTTWADPSGRPMRLSMVMSSGGRRQAVDAVFSKYTVAIDNDNAGTKTKKSLRMPDGPISLDITHVPPDKLKPGQTSTVFVLDTTTLTFVKNQINVVGPSKATVNGKQVPGTLVNVVDPRGTSHVYLDDSGGVIKVEGPLGIAMIPESRGMALSSTGPYDPSKDLAIATAIPIDKPIKDPDSLSVMNVRLGADSIGGVPSDDFQSVVHDAQGWIVSVHPPKIGERSMPIATAAQLEPQWTRPSLNIPSDSAKMKNVASIIVGPETDVDKAAMRIRKWVNAQMVPNAGIGVLRDANDILNSLQGVCRDYATLTVCLARAAGIPSRLASGLVYSEGSFYYHAWAECFDGYRWIGVDSTTAQDQISATHIKLAEGNVETAFAFTFLEHANLTLLSTEKH